MPTGVQNFFESHSSVAGPALVLFSRASRGIAGTKRWGRQVLSASWWHQCPKQDTECSFDTKGPDLGTVDPEVRFI